MALTAEFGGSASLPTGWTFAQDGTGTATLDNTGRTAVLTIPAGVAADSITSPGSSDKSAGLVHAVSGDFDLAFRVDTVIGGDNSAMFGFILRGADDSDMVRYQVYAVGLAPRQYGYARFGGAGNNFRSASVLPSGWLESHGAWLRAVRSGSDFEFFMSGDGYRWAAMGASFTGSNDPQTVKLSLGQYADKVGAPFRIARSVDLAALGGTDARAPVPVYSPGATEVTDFSTLPAWLELQSQGDGDAVHAAGEVTLSTDAADGSTGRLAYTGVGYENAGMLIRYRCPVTGSSYLAIGLGVDDGGPVPMDVYANGPGYITEIEVATGQDLPVRIHRPLSISQFNEPYVFLYFDQEDGRDLTDLWWFRIEKFGARLRMRTWEDGTPEPSTWWFDGEEDTQRDEGLLQPYASVSHNDGSPAATELVIDSLAFYELNAGLPSASGDAALAWGWAASAAGADSTLRASGDAALSWSWSAAAAGADATIRDGGDASLAWGWAASATGAESTAVGAGDISLAWGWAAIVRGGEPGSEGTAWLTLSSEADVDLSLDSPTVELAVAGEGDGAVAVSVLLP